MTCPAIANNMANDNLKHGATYTKLYGDISWAGLTQPVQWTLMRTGTGGGYCTELLSNPSLYGAAGYITWVPTSGSQDPTILWHLLLVDNNGCGSNNEYDFTWTTTIEGCPAIANNMTADIFKKGTTYEKLYGFPTGDATWTGLTEPVLWGLENDIVGDCTSSLINSSLWNDTDMLYWTDDNNLESGTLINWILSLEDNSGCVYYFQWQSTVKSCPDIPNAAKNDYVTPGKIYKKQYGLTSLRYCNDLTAPLTWAITSGPSLGTVNGGYLSLPNMDCATNGVLNVGELVYSVPIGEPLGTVYNWKVTLSDTNGCNYEASWTTTVTSCDNNYANDTAISGTMYEKTYGLTTTNLRTPLIWSITSGPGGSLSDSAVCCGNTGKLTYAIPSSATVGSSYNWTITCTDSNNDSCTFQWTTTMICPTIAWSAKDDVVVAGTTYTKKYGLDNCFKEGIPNCGTVEGDYYYDYYPYYVYLNPNSDGFPNVNDIITVNNQSVVITWVGDYYTLNAAYLFQVLPPLTSKPIVGQSWCKVSKSPLLKAPLTWAIVEGPPAATLDKPNMDCATNDVLNIGTLTYEVPIARTDDISWRMSVKDSDDCIYYNNWTTKVLKNISADVCACVMNCITTGSQKDCWNKQCGCCDCKLKYSIEATIDWPASNQCSQGYTNCGADYDLYGRIGSSTVVYYGNQNPGDGLALNRDAHAVCDTILGPEIIITGHKVGSNFVTEYLTKPQDIYFWYNRYSDDAAFAPGSSSRCAGISPMDPSLTTDKVKFTNNHNTNRIKVVQYSWDAVDWVEDSSQIINAGDSYEFSPGVGKSPYHASRTQDANFGKKYSVTCLDPAHAFINSELSKGMPILYQKRIRSIKAKKVFI